MLVLVIVIIGAVLRFYGLMWGDGFFFHPDENNMARAIAQMTLENRLHPNFFAYGQLPLFLAWIMGYITNILDGNQLQFVQMRNAVFWLRAFSALFSVATIILTYRLAKTMFDESFNQKTIHIRWGSLNLPIESWSALLASLFVAFCPGLIQAAHFGTTESMMTFWYVLLTLLSIGLLHKTTKLRTFMLGIVFGMALATKMSAGYFIIMMLATRIIISVAHWKRKNRKKAFRYGLGITFIAGFASVLSFVLFSPFNIIDSYGFLGSMEYETRVASGDVVVFYTKQFIDSVPILFQIINVFPYTLGIPLTLISAVGIIFGVYQSAKKPKQSYALILVLIALFGYTLPNMFLFTKWTRFMTPALPFLCIFAAYALYQLTHYIKYKTLSVLIITTVVIISIIPGVDLFMIYTTQDARVQASRWIHTNIPEGSYIVSETANVVDIPVSLPSESDIENRSYTVISFDFYHVDQDDKGDELVDHLVQADYIFVPSRRIFANHLGHDQYQIVNNYYEALFNGGLGFEPVVVCNLECYIPENTPQDKAYSGKTLANKILQGDEHAEETFSVFDHPTIRIYQKTNMLTEDEYRTLLGL